MSGGSERIAPFDDKNFNLREGPGTVPIEDGQISVSSTFAFNKQYPDCRGQCPHPTCSHSSGLHAKKTAMVATSGLSLALGEIGIVAGQRSSETEKK